MVLEDSEITGFSEMDLYLLMCCEVSRSKFATTACGPVFFPGVEKEKQKYLGFFPHSYSKSTLSIPPSPFTIMVA